MSAGSHQNGRAALSRVAAAFMVFVGFSVAWLGWPGDAGEPFADESWRMGSRLFERLPAECRPSATPAMTSPLLHSHNDYEQPAPLLTALEQGFDSIEVDLWNNGETLAVGHLPWRLRGTFSEMYLRPLWKMFSALKERARKSGWPLLVWVDLKESSPRLSELLWQELHSSGFAKSLVESDSPVRMVPTGSREGRRSFFRQVAFTAQRSPPSWIAFEWVALDWRLYFSWTGRERFSSEEFARLRALLSDEHRHGRRVRFYGAPDGPVFWMLAACAGVDMVGTDHPQRLRAAIRELRGSILQGSSVHESATRHTSGD